jgi:hypothetical protein
MNIIEIEDAIPKLYQDQVELETSSADMPWYFHEETAATPSDFAESFSGFSHLALHATQPVASGLGPSLVPLLFVFCDRAKLPLDTILRIRVGLFTCSARRARHHNPHVDFREPHYTAVYYANDSDGDTVVFNETTDKVDQRDAARYAAENRFTVARRISPKKGKMACFDGKHYHASMHPSAHATRIVITYNFK